MIIMVHDSFHGLFPKIRGKERERGGVGAEIERECLPFDLGCCFLLLLIEWDLA